MKERQWVSEQKWQEKVTRHQLLAEWQAGQALIVLRGAAGHVVSKGAVSEITDGVFDDIGSAIGGAVDNVVDGISDFVGGLFCWV